MGATDGLADSTAYGRSISGYQDDTHLGASGSGNSGGTLK